MCLRMRRMCRLPNHVAALFELANMTYNPAFVTNHSGFIFPTFQDENAAWFKLAVNWFPQTLTPPHSIAVSNFGFSPQLRITEMNFFSEIVGGGAMQFRCGALYVSLVGV